MLSLDSRRGPQDQTHHRQGRDRRPNIRIKLYVGTFERSSRFEAHLDPTGIALIQERPGAELRAALEKFSTLIAFQTNATKRVLIGSLLTEEEAGLDRAIASIPPPAFDSLTGAAPKSATSTVVSSVRSWGATGCCVII
jgi:hypothetical protein